MLDQYEIFQTILNSVKELIGGNASRSTYVILALIPVCIAVAIREIWCWFIKQNKLVYKMERVEKQLLKTNQLLEMIGKEIKEQRLAPPATSSSKEFIPATPKDYDKAREKVAVASDERAEPKSMGDRKFSL